MKHNLILVILFFTFISGVQSQTEVDERAMIHFDKGLGFNTPDSLFGVNIRFRMQNLVMFTTNSDNDLNIKSIDARVRRLRLRFDGFLGNSGKLTYYIQLAFSREDQDWDNTHIPNIIRDAMVYYRFNKDFYIGFGQGKLPGNRQRITSSGLQQFLDRSVVNASFNIDRDFGLFAYYSGRIGPVAYNFKGAISDGEGRGTLRTDNGLAYTGRFELLPFGKFKSDGDFLEGDLYREQKPKLSLGFAYSYNDKTKKLAGQRGVELANSVDLTSAFADMIFKYKGFSNTTEFCMRTVDNPYTLGIENDTVVVLKGNGINTQFSYIFKNNFEIAARYTVVNPDKSIQLDESNVKIYTVGVTRYLKEHRVKVQANINYRQYKYNLPVIKTTSDWQLGFLIELGI